MLKNLKNFVTADRPTRFESRLGRECNDIEVSKALDFQLRGLHIEPSGANFALAAILHGGKKDYRQH